MLDTTFGQKVNMTQTFVGDTRVPATVIKFAPCVVTQIRTHERDGYWAVQLGVGTRSLKNITKPVKKHLKDIASEGKAPRFLREVRFKSEPKVKVGDVVNFFDVLKSGDKVSVTGVSKGKGFAGVVKRWGFAGGPKTHGQSNRHRSPGSIGQGTTPGRVWKGKKMGGRMGSDSTTIKNLTVIGIDKEKSEILLSGAVPGPRGGLIKIKRLAHGLVEELIEEVPEAQVQESAEEVQKEEKKET